MHRQGYLLLAIAVPNLILGTFILLRNAKDRTNLFFAGISLSTGFWSLGLAGFIFSQGFEAAYNWAKVYYTAAALIAAFFLAFSLNFTGRWQKLKLGSIILGLLPIGGLILLIFGFPQFLLSNIVYHDWGKEVILNKKGYLLYSLYFVFYVLTSFWVLYYALRESRGLPRVYLKFILFGFIIAFSLGATFNLFYPAFGNYRFIWVGPLFTVSYISLVSYAIIRHKLFDIRLIVARSLGYLLSVFALGAFFGLIAFNLVNSLIFHTMTVTFAQQIAYTMLALALAFTYQPLKRFFDRLTNRLFYRDAYEPQALIDNLNKELVGTIELEKLLFRSAKVINDTIKSEFCIFAIKAINNIPFRLIGANQRALHEKDITNLHEQINKTSLKVIVADELGDGHQELRQDLQANDLAIITVLSNTGSTSKNSLGYLLLGSKKSGNPYSAQDARILGIIADELVIAIQNALRFEEIENFNVTLQEKVDNATRQLRQTNEKLKALDETKDEFISMASHQLRTPLTSVKGYISMVLEGDAGKLNAMEKKLLTQAFISSQRMVYLIADLLNVSRLKTGKFIIESAPTQLADVVEGELQQLVETAKGRNITLVYNKPHDFPTLMLDETKIRQVIMNFADNAIYYTPSGGTITIDLKEVGESIELTVTDTGIGVPKAQQHHLFTKFFRADNAQSARPDGTGLGLFMAKKVIVAQGGAIIFRSQEGKGSTFGFTFAKARMHIPGHIKIDKKDKHKDIVI